MSDETTNHPIRDESRRPQESGLGLARLPVRVIESAAFVGLVTAILYFMGYSYYAGFFERISLPRPYPELSTSDYFLQAFSSLTGVIVAALSTIPFPSTAPTTIWTALWVNAAFIITPLLFVHNAHSNGFLDLRLALFLGAIAAVGIIASTLKVSLLKRLTSSWGLSGAIAYGFGLLMFLSVYFRLEGAADAAKFIEGKLEPSSSIVLQTSDETSPANGTRLLVALARGGSFYLVRQESPPPEAPVVYFVPESEVLTATMQRAGTATATPAR